MQYITFARNVKDSYLVYLARDRGFGKQKSLPAQNREVGIRIKLSYEATFTTITGAKSNRERRHVILLVNHETCTQRRHHHEG